MRALFCSLTVCKHSDRRTLSFFPLLKSLRPARRPQKRLFIAADLAEKKTPLCCEEKKSKEKEELSQSARRMVRVNRSFTLLPAAHIGSVPAVNRAVMKQVLQQRRAIDGETSITTGCKSSDNSACMPGQHMPTDLFRAKGRKEQQTQQGGALSPLT